MKIKIFVAREIQYFEIGIFPFNSYVYYLTRGFIAPTGAFNLLTRAFNLPTGALNLRTRTFNLATRAFSLLTRGFELVTRGFELVTRRFELVTRRFELVTHGFELITRNSLFHLYFCFFTFKNAHSCSFKYFESSDVIVVKKKSIKSLLTFAILMF